jgi:hypothetical protein
MFHPALWKLIRLQWHGGFRQFTRSLRTFRGLFHFGFIIAMLVYGTGSMYFAGRLTSRSPQLAGTLDTLQTDIVTLGLFGVTCYTILFSTGEAVVYFTSSEVAFLFPAPLTRKQLLTYKLMKSFLGIAAISAFLSLFSIRQISLAIPRFAATMLTITFLQLLTMNVAFARQVLQENMHVLFRRLLGSLLAVLVVLAIAQTMFAAPAGDFTTIVKGFQQSTVRGCSPRFRCLCGCCAPPISARLSLRRRLCSASTCCCSCWPSASMRCPSKRLSPRAKRWRPA